jgi:hypothetical protein
MNWTKEDIDKAKDFLSNEGYGTGSNFTVNLVANLMAEYAAKSKAENLPISDVVGRSEQLTAFTEWLKDNHSIEIHDMILQDYIRYGS